MFIFPWSNLHELNLDWILAQVKKFAELIPPMESAVENIEEALDDATEAKNKAEQALEDANEAIETAEEAKEIAEQAAQGTIADGAVTTVKLADGAVTRDKIDPSFIGTGTFDTTSQTVIGSVNEIKSALDNLSSDNVANDSENITGNNVTDVIDSIYNSIVNIGDAFKEFHFYYDTVAVSGGNSGTVFPNNFSDLPSNYIVLGVRGIWTGAGNIVVRGYVASTGEINYTSTTTQTQNITANMLVLCLDTNTLESFF